MRNSDWRVKLAGFFQPWPFWMTLVTAIWGATLKAPVDDFSPFWKGVFLWLQQWAWFGITGLTIGALVIEHMRKRFGSPKAWDSLKAILNFWQAQIFEDEKFSEDPSHYHRITLFKYSAWINPWTKYRTWLRRRAIKGWWLNPYNFLWKYPIWSGWLVPVVRSGHLTQNSLALFRVPDSGDVEGIAGQAFTCKKPIHKVLPDINSESDDQFKLQFAKDGFVSLEWVEARLQNRQQMYLSFLAFQITGPTDYPWGIIVVESVCGDLPKEEILKQVPTIARVVSRLVEGL